jgi:betaine-aldehyde dehydrogenase
MDQALSRKDFLYIGGKWVAPSSTETFSNFRPTTGDVLCEVAQASAEDVDKANKAARACLESDAWGYKSTGAQRASVLRAFGKILISRKKDIATVDSIDHGKPLREAEADIDDAIGACEHFALLAEQQDRDQDEVIDVGDKNWNVTIRHEPLGVVACITPWNYPFLMAIWKVVPAIAAGCTIVLKPSELAPLSCLLLADLLSEAGLPAGALNVLNGVGATTGAAITAHPGFDKISFTGSVPTARRVMAAAAMGPRGISLELGGKSPLIVCEDGGDMDAIVDWVLTGILWGSGQVCSATSRVLVHESLMEELVKRVVEKALSVPIGDTQSENAMGDSPFMGPVINKVQYDKIWNYIDEAKTAGYSVFGGERDTVASLGNGYFVPPTIFVDPPIDSRVWKEEIFGPVLCMRSFSSEAEAVKEANNTTYGLAAAVFSTNTETLKRITSNLRAGIVWTNNCQPAFIQAPWGGVKQSGFGRELGRWGLEEFTAVKQVCGCENGFKWDLW